MNEFDQHALFHRILLRFGWRFVNHQQQMLIYRDGMASYVLPAGYHRPINRWRESYGDFVSTAIRTTHIEQISVQTKDCIPVLVDVDVMYSFDANACASSGIMTSISGLSRRQLNGIVERNARLAVQSVAGEYIEEQLADGSNYPAISRKVRIWLQAKVGILGLVFRGDTAVAITRITPPTIIDEARQLAHRNQIYANSVTHLPQEVARDLNSQEIARRSKSVELAIVEHRGHSEQDAPYSIYNNRLRPHGSKRHYEEEVSV
jgi:hypothetical protein